MIKAVIFDIGNVLISFNPKAYLSGMFTITETVEALYNIIFRSDEWVRLDMGTLSHNEAVDIHISRHPEYSKEIHMAMDNWHSMLTSVEGMEAVLQELKSKGYKLYYLSNYHELASEYILSYYSFFDLFDGGVFSFAEKTIKPGTRIYEILLERYKLNAKECVFIDDMTENVETAESLGIKGIQFQSPALLKCELEAVLTLY